MGPRSLAEFWLLCLFFCLLAELYPGQLPFVFCLWLARPFGSLKSKGRGGGERERELKARKLLRHSCCKGSIRFRTQRYCRSFSEVFRVVVVFSPSLVRGCRDSSQVQVLGPNLLAVFPTNPNELLR